MEGRIRAFLCLELPSAVRQVLWRRTSSLGKRYPGFKWVSAESLHITLKFLGECEGAFLDMFERALENRLVSLAPADFPLLCGPLAAFPDSRRTRVIFSEVIGDVMSLSKIASVIDGLARENGIPGDRRMFRPHITLARTRCPESLALPNFDTINPLLEWRADSVTFMQSVLTPSGPLYTPLKIWKFSDLQHV